MVLISGLAFHGYPVNVREKLPADDAWEFPRHVFRRIYKERRIKMDLLKKLALVGVFSSFAMGAYAGDIGDTAGAISSVASIQGNVAVGVNTKETTITSEASGGGSVSNAGRLVDRKSVV